MRVDFYHLTRDTAPKVVPLLARATLTAGERLLLVAGTPELRKAVSQALWEDLPAEFLAHGEADGPHAARQPILLSAATGAPNGARYCCLADGRWREGADRFDRIFLLFGEEELEEARSLWRKFGPESGVERRFWKQDGGRWREGP